LEEFENLNTESTESAPSEAPAAESGQSEQPTAQEILDLDSVEKFRFSGRELTPKELQSMVMMQSDYTRKTQQIAEERKYYDNLSVDLEAVKRNPSLAAQFKSTYPAKFHSYLGYAVQNYQQQTQQNPQNASQGQNPRQADSTQFEQRLSQMESDFQERKVAAAEQEIDLIFKKNAGKFPMADEEAVLARAQTLLDRLRTDNGPSAKITDSQWDNLFKSVHERNQKLADKYYSDKINKQKQANARGKDAAPGGGIPGQAPSQPRTLKAAADLARRAMETET
jgi:hypothetical protein